MKRRLLALCVAAAFIMLSQPFAYACVSSADDKTGAESTLPTDGYTSISLSMPPNMENTMGGGASFMSSDATCSAVQRTSSLFPIFVSETYVKTEIKLLASSQALCGGIWEYDDMSVMLC